MPYYRLYHVGRPTAVAGLDRDGDVVACVVCGNPDCLDYRLEVEPLGPDEDPGRAYCCPGHAAQWAEKMSTP